MVAFLAEAEELRGDIRGLLKRCPDLERALARLTLGRGGPRDLAALRDGLTQAAALKAMLDQDILSGTAARRASRPWPRAMGHHDLLVERLGRALAAELPVNARDGGIIAAGYAPDLDELKTLRDESRRLIAALQSRYAEQSGVAGLKVKHNNVLGYFIEVTATHADKLMGQSDFIHRQTLARRDALYHRRAVGARAQDRQRGRQGPGSRTAAFRGSGGRSNRPCRGHRPGGPRPGRSRMPPLAWRRLRVEGRWTRPRVDNSLAFASRAGAIRWSKRPWPAARRAPSLPTTALWAWTGRVTYRKPTAAAASGC